MKEIGKLSKPLRKDGTARSLDLAKAALEIAAEDDALVSHSPVPLPVDAYIDRLESMAVEFAHHYLPAQDKSPTALFEALDIYLYGYQVATKLSTESSMALRKTVLSLSLCIDIW